MKKKMKIEENEIVNDIMIICRMSQICCVAKHVVIYANRIRNTYIYNFGVKSINFASIFTLYIGHYKIKA